MNADFLQLIQDIPSRYTQVHGWLLYGLVRTLQPALVVETGTCLGYITAFLAQGLIDCGGNGTLYTIDSFDGKGVHKNDYDEVKKTLQRIAPLKNLHVLKGETIDTLTRLSDEGLITNLSLAVLDDDHSRGHVEKEIDICYKHLVSLGCIAGHDVFNRDLIGVNEAFKSRIDKYGFDSIWSHHSSGYIICQKRDSHCP
jgi:predicted O-methyltransferase YrrM